MFYVYALYKLQVLKHIHQQTGLGRGDRAWTVVKSEGGGGGVRPYVET